MALGSFIPPVDLAAVRPHLGGLLRLFAFVVLPPLLVALFAQEWQLALVFGLIAIGSFGLGFLTRKDPRSSLSPRDAMFVTAFGYAAFFVFGALAYWPEVPFIDGLFESVSGFTTTGLSVLGPESLPHALVFFRAYSQWLGGIGIILLTVAISDSTMRNAAMRLYGSESGQPPFQGSTLASTRRLFIIYSSLTLLCFLLLAISGLGAWDALLYAMSTLSTGGFAPTSSGAEDLIAQRSVIVVLCVFMVIGATSFSLIQASRADPMLIFRDPQLRTLIALIVLAGGLFYWFDQEALGAIFHAISGVTTTGFSINGTTLDSDAGKLVAVFTMLVGGSSGSSAGGLKLLRLVLLVQVMRWVLARALLPSEAKVPLKFGGETVDGADAQRIFGFVVGYFAVFWLATFVLVAAGFPLIDAAFENASALGTVGLSSGITRPELGPGVKLMLCGLMWIGRLEILPVVVLFAPSSWRRWERSR